VAPPWHCTAPELSRLHGRSIVGRMYRLKVLYTLGYLLWRLVQRIGRDRGGELPGERYEPPHIADEVQGWLWLRDEFGYSGSGGTDAHRNEPPDKG
jgi:hypothetical protein